MTINNDMKGLLKEAAGDKLSLKSNAKGKCDPQELKDFFENYFKPPEYNNARQIDESTRILERTK